MPVVESKQPQDRIVESMEGQISRNKDLPADALLAFSKVTELFRIIFLHLQSDL